MTLHFCEKKPMRIFFRVLISADIFLGIADILYVFGGKH